MGFYDADAIEQVAINLFYGWGYNFYRLENQLRADDLLVREKVGWLLGQCRAMVTEAESAYRKQYLPPPSRAKPLPDADAVASARALEELAGRFGDLAAMIRSLPVPETDRMTQRYRQEAETLAMLAACDKRLAGIAGVLLRQMEGHDAAWLLGNAGPLREALAALQAAVTERGAMLK